VETARNLVAGEWRTPEVDEHLDVHNPSTGEVIGRTPMSTARQADEAIEAAHRAYLEWCAVPASQRVRPLFQLTELLRANEERIARTLTEEMGKSLPDSRAELKRTIENCEVACGTPVLQQGDKLVGAAPGIDGEVLRVPRGVYTMIAPFNFPAMVPFWFLPYAIATGNTFVVKPSERVPFTMQAIARLIEATDLPPGVFNLVNGSVDVANAFMEHADVAGVSMVGSTRVAALVAARCAANNKRFQAMGGAKNHLVVMPDAHMDEVVRNMITSCYGCAGQRCMAASAIVAVGDETYTEVCQRFVEASKRVLVANPLDPAVAAEPMLMGPVISAQAKQFVLDMIQKGIEEGATLACDGRALRVPGAEGGFFVGPTVFTDVRPGMQIHQTEIFGPVLAILRAANLEEAIRILNDHPYGNGASIYTQSGHWARQFKLDTRAGMIGINVGIPAPVAALPFGGMKQSQFSHIKAQGKYNLDFFTEARVITERYWPER
jgi:malonate-semialdehyde dehydrogenase (acetylating)/methylmalonate-semialdehyde dehydrogenase